MPSGEAWLGEESPVLDWDAETRDACLAVIADDVHAAMEAAGLDGTEHPLVFSGALGDVLPRAAREVLLLSTVDVETSNPGLVRELESATLMSAWNTCLDLDRGVSYDAVTLSASVVSYGLDFDSNEPVAEAAQAVSLGAWWAPLVCSDYADEALAWMEHNAEPAGTIDDPLPWDSTVSSDAASVTLGKAMWDAVDAIAARNRFNDTPAAGMTQVLLPLTVTGLLTIESVTPRLDIDVAYVTPDGDTYESGGLIIPQPLADVDDLWKGDTATGNLAFTIPVASIGHGVWAVEFRGTEPVYIASHGTDSVQAPGVAETLETKTSTSDTSTSGRSSSDTSGNDSNAGTPDEDEDFDTSWAKTQAGHILEDIAEGDERFNDSPEIGASRTMGFLADDMSRLLDAGFPPGIDEADYYARVSTLEDFFLQAQSYLYAGDITNAAAAYQVARDNVPALLKTLNSALGTNYSIPAWEYMP